MGISFPSRNKCKLFADFYASDIIIASPVGLRQAINIGIGQDLAEKKEKGNLDVLEQEESESEDSDTAEVDVDFLSSIELCVVDEAEVFSMQNWQHVEDVLKAVNQQPLRIHPDTDFSRVRECILGGYSRQCRQ